MLDNKGFDLWADGYDRSVGLCEEGERYPFAGYQKVLGTIYRQVRTRGCQRVLDLGFGTGILTRRLYEDGCRVTGVDFSPRMVEIAREKMPGAELFLHDFTQGLPDALAGRRFDAIISTYALHHLEDEEKPGFFARLLEHLAPGGIILAGDVAFATRAELDICRSQAGPDWDGEERYLVMEELSERLPGVFRFQPFSPCAGVLGLAAREEEL